MEVFLNLRERPCLSTRHDINAQSSVDLAKHHQIFIILWLLRLRCRLEMGLRLWPWGGFRVQRFVLNLCCLVSCHQILLQWFWVLVFRFWWPWGASVLKLDLRIPGILRIRFRIFPLHPSERTLLRKCTVLNDLSGLLRIANGRSLKPWVTLTEDLLLFILKIIQ